MLRARWPNRRQLNRSSVDDIASVSRELRPLMTSLAASSSRSLEVLLVQYTAWALFLNGYDQCRQIQRHAQAGMVSNTSEFQFDPALFVNSIGATHPETSSQHPALTVAAGTIPQKSKDFEGLVDSTSAGQKRRLEEASDEVPEADHRPWQLAKTHAQTDVQQALQREEAGRSEIVNEMTARHEEHKTIVLQLNHLVTRMDEVHNDFNGLAAEAEVRKTNIAQLRAAIGDHVEYQESEGKRPTDRRQSLD